MGDFAEDHPAVGTAIVGGLASDDGQRPPQYGALLAVGQLQRPGQVPGVERDPGRRLRRLPGRIGVSFCRTRGSVNVRTTTSVVKGEARQAT